MKIRKFNEKVIVPNVKNFEILTDVEKSLHNGEVNSLEGLNNITSEHGFEFVKHSDFKEAMKDVKDVAETMPDKGDRQMIPNILWFFIMNKKTGKINIVLDDSIENEFKHKMRSLLNFPVFKSILGHEDVHRQQIQRMGDSKYYIVRDPNNKKEYLSDPNEIMAYAYSIINDLKDDNYSKEELLDKIAKGDLSFSKGKMMTGGKSSFHPIYFDYVETLKKDSKEFKKLQKYMYLYILELFGDSKSNKETNIHDKINFNMEMDKIKKFETFVESISVANAPKTAPTKPGTKPAQPGTKPSKPGRRIKPSVKPRPKAEKKDYLDNLIDRFEEESTTNDKKEIIDYYAKKNK